MKIFLIILSYLTCATYSYGQEVLWSTAEPRDTEHIPLEKAAHELLKLYDNYEYYNDVGRESKDYFLNKLDMNEYQEMADIPNMISKIENQTLIAFRNEIGTYHSTLVLSVNADSIAMIDFSNIKYPESKKTHFYEKGSFTKRLEYFLDLTTYPAYEPEEIKKDLVILDHAVFENKLNEDCHNVSLGETKIKLFEWEAFRFKYPQNWEVTVISEHQDTVYLLRDNTVLSNETNLTNEPFYRKYGSFQNISFTLVKKTDSFDYDQNFEKAHQHFSENRNFNVQEIGTSTYNSQKANWIKYIDETYKEEKIQSEALLIYLMGSKYCLWVMIQTYDLLEKELRLCRAFEILKTLTLN